MEVWDAAVGPLHDAGFRTLRFDLSNEQNGPARR